MKFSIHVSFSLLSLLSLFSPTLLFAHEGHDAAPGEEGSQASGPIAISAEARKNLGLEVVEADIQTLDRTLSLIGQIETIPSQSGVVSSRIEGKLTKLYATEGQYVKAGDVVAEVESLLVGDPPPIVRLTTPISGLVMDRHVVIGDNVEPAMHLLEIGDLSTVYAAGYLFEGQVSQISIGQNVRVEVESFPGKTFEGTVDLISGSLDPETRTLEIWIRIDNPELLLRPNMRARITVVINQSDVAITVPLDAVLGEFGQFFVFVQSDTDDTVFEKRAVVLGMKNDRYYEVLEGVFPSDKVVTTGNYQLQYVTTRKIEPATEMIEDHSETETHAHKTSPLDIPLKTMGYLLGALLVLNLIATLLRSKRAKSSDDSFAQSQTKA